MSAKPPILATLAAALSATAATAQELPSGASSYLPVTCFPPGVVKSMDVLGLTIARGISHDRFSFYEMKETPNGWLLVVRNQKQLCIVAAGKDLAQPLSE